MNVFFSWSGPLSHGLATAFYEWVLTLPLDVTPFLSSKETDSGQRWRNVIDQALASNVAGIFFLTPENSQSRWMHFEAGALAKNIDESRVIVLAFNFSSLGDIKDPLGMFMNRMFCQEDVRRLVCDLYRWSRGDGDMKPIETAFERAWPDLEARIEAELEPFRSAAPATTKIADPALEEILAVVREIRRSLGSGVQVLDTFVPRNDAEIAIRCQLDAVRAEAAREDEDRRLALAKMTHPLGSEVIDTSGRSATVEGHTSTKGHVQLIVRYSTGEKTNQGIQHFRTVAV